MICRCRTRWKQDQLTFDLWHTIGHDGTKHKLSAVRDIEGSGLHLQLYTMALRMESIPALIPWDKLLCRANELQFMEDNTAMVQVANAGRNPTMRTLGRTHGISIRELHERFKRTDLQLQHCKTINMAAGISTKASESKGKWSKACELIRMLHR